MVVNLVGGFTQQRKMATERIVRKSLCVNPPVLHITVGPKDNELQMFAPVVDKPLKVAWLKQCEELVKMNCANFECLRLEANRIDEGCDQIKQFIYSHLK